MIDGPFAETKEQLLGFYVVDCDDLDEALDVAARARRGQSRRRLRDPPGRPCSRPGASTPMTDIAWIDAALTSARPQAVGALLRYFRDLDMAEEAFQDACLRALKTWPQNGPPRDPAAWLIMVGRNVAHRRRPRAARKQAAAARRGRRSPTSTTPRTQLAERLDGAHYRDDILRLLFICCHPDLPATQQIALALRIVSGLTVTQIARAFLVGEAAMEQRITRAKARVAEADVPFETPGAVERAERLAAVAAMIYLVFNEGYSAARRAAGSRAPLCDEAIRLARLLLRLFPAEPEIMGLTALMLLQHARAAARFDADGEIVLLEDQDRALWNRPMIAEGLALVDKAMRHRRARPLPGPGRDRRAACPRRNARGHRLGRRSTCSTARSNACSPRRSSRSTARSRCRKVRGPEAALDMIEPLAQRLAGYFYFHGVRGALAAAARPQRRGARSPSTGPSRWPTPPPRPPISACISTACSATASRAATR